MEDSTRITDPYIWVTENLLSTRQCNSVIKKYEQNKNQAKQGVTGGGVQLHIKNSKDIVFDQATGWEKQDKQFHIIVG